ncbi:MAG: SRPBCC domain-containing protein [Sporocytophaga sp.]|uniref:SRPBCC domain-containing protein n=1 Tax=Sporocytophaga sp. TaxID=2231183 RepID=UPI001B2BE793|nr:SRPBCC domain-containing protein [Sporocytophaga sp.]MBO9700446.1 SRPBCC domain-containing protein [Sporocytophaga sp.]
MEKIIKNTIEIKAEKDQVWDMLTNPEQTKKYMFGCETVSDWKTGSPLLWKGHYEGKDMIFVKGTILEINLGKRLKYTVIDPNASYPDIPDNYLNVTYELSDNDGKTVLTVTQDGYDKVAEGEKRFKESYNNGEGWTPILVAIKDLLKK